MKKIILSIIFLLILFATKNSYSLSTNHYFVDSIAPSPHVLCDNCMDLKIYLGSNINDNESDILSMISSITYQIINNQIEIIVQIDTVYEGCFIPTVIYNGLADTAITICNIEPSFNYSIVCGSYYYSYGFFPIPVLHEDSVFNHTTSINCYDPFPKDEFFCSDKDESITLYAGNGYSFYYWEPNGETTETITVAQEGKYKVSVTDSIGNVFEDSMEVVDVCPQKCFIPNSFTPNNDGVNDLFIPLCDDVVAGELVIYNRWGQLICIINNFTNGWNGSNLNGKREQEGVYIWKLESRGNDKKVKSVCGHVALLK